MWLVIISLPLLIYPVYLYLGWFWLLGGFSFPMYCTVRLFRKTLQLDKPQEELPRED